MTAPTRHPRPRTRATSRRPRVLVLSHCLMDPATEEVLEWMQHLGGDAVRVNGEDLTWDAPFRITLEPGEHGTAGHAHGAIGGAELDGFSAFWLRRWHSRATLAYLLEGEGDGRLRHSVWQYLTRELSALREGVALAMRHAYGPTLPEQTQVSKLRVLATAAAAGLRIPATLVTNSRAELLAFIERHGAVITKPLSEVATFPAGGHSYALYTAEVTAEVAGRLPDTFFPSLFQAKVPKRLEVRAFVLDDEIWAMALFSQSDARTGLDFRRVGADQFTRTVPYRLPAGEQAAIRRVMNAIGLATGSVDLIRTSAGEHVFLEVNPVGQFGFVSEPCNYYLEKRMAERLLVGDRDERH